MIRILIFVILILISLYSCQKKPTQSEDEEVKENVLKTKKVIFFSSDRDSEAKNIFMMTINGEIIKKITNYSKGEFAATAISPDSNQLLFYQAVPGLDIDSGRDIYIYKIKEDTIIGPITQGHPGNFSPNGENFVFHRYTFIPNAGFESVYIYDLINNSEIKLTEHGNKSFYAQFSPNGNTICYESAYFFTRDSMSCWQLHLMDLNGNYIKALTSPLHGYYAGSGVFSSDGKSIIFNYNEQTWCFDICKLDIASNTISYITNTRFNGNLTSPNYYRPFVDKSDGNVYFYSKKYNQNDEYVTEICFANIEGTQIKQITNNDYWDSHPVVGIVSYYIEE